ncbi:phage tail tube protein FII [Roseibium sp. TrichSKD4]|uniref:phage major tail tube protein n=1 Tax=Roseibium sp. TrichSKD4 TaxID=744980 RepID=UPI0001E56F45|nr:phage major tail tube protein [Roseibium sp. TrichSKD4]EFO31328.1 phage tail tube protein FII [Roseibium sp. TrichSKD4]
MARANIQRNMSLTIDGIGYAGVVNEVTPPVITRVMEETRGGGMDGVLKEDLGQEAMQITLTIHGTKHELLKHLFGPGLGASIVLRTSNKQQGKGGTQIIYKVTGSFSSYDLGTLSMGSKNSTTITGEVEHYEIIEDGKEALFIDIENCIFRVWGEDWKEDERNHIGL